MTIDRSTQHPSVRSGRDGEGPDAHGQAALLLTESLLHILLGKGVLNLDEAIETVQVATEVKIEVADELGDSRARMQQSLDLLAAISHSLSHEARAGEA